ncbi:unnamed protein product [Peniophora sp. CBMAI 1063]|nr:unnamed protein product [Peniophora sp. CBMAI 1063]
MAHTQSALANLDSKGRDLLIYHGGAFNWLYKRSRSAQGIEAHLIINGITRARGCAASKDAAMEAAAANLVWTETETAVHSLGRLPAQAPAPKARPEHLTLLRQHFQKHQLRWLPALQVYRLREKPGRNPEDLWASSWVAVVAVNLGDRGTYYHRGEAFDEKAASYEAARVALKWHADAMGHGSYGRRA